MRFLLLLLLFFLLPTSTSAAYRYQSNNNASPDSNPYFVLGVWEGATMDSIKQAYRQKAKEHHPDKNRHLDPTVANKRFRRVQDAWELLNDPNKKRQLDAQLKRQRQRMNHHHHHQQQQQQQQRMTTTHRTSHSWGTHNTNNNQQQQQQRQQQQYNYNQQNRQYHHTMTNQNGYEHHTFTERQNNQQQQRNYQSSSYGSHKNNNNNQQQQYQRSHQHYKTSSHGSHNQQQSHQQNNHQQQQQQQARAKMAQAAKEAQEHVWKLTSLEELQTSSLLDHQGRFTKHFVAVFMGNDRMEMFVDNTLLFPHPFTGKGRNGMQWHDHVQTAKIIYHSKPSPLTKAFGVPDKSLKPTVVVVRRGETLDQYVTYQPKSWAASPQLVVDFENWILQHFKCEVTIVNWHHHPILVYYKDATNTWRQFDPVPPQHQTTPKFSLSDRIVILDATMDQMPGTTHTNKFQTKWLDNDELVKAIAMQDFLVMEMKQHVEVGRGFGTTRSCHDRSAHCQEWLRAKTSMRFTDPKQSKCDSHWEYGHSICPKTCGVCTETIHPLWNDLRYTLLHKPLHQFPSFMRSLLISIRSVQGTSHYFMEDLTHLWTMRRNVTAAFVAMGFLAGIQIVLVAQMLFHIPRPQTIGDLVPIYRLGLWLLVTLSVGGCGMWLAEAKVMEVPIWLRTYQYDWKQTIRFSRDIIKAIVYLGFLTWVLARKVADRVVGKAATSRLSRLIVMSLALIMVSTGLVGGASYMLQNDILVNGHKHVRYLRWEQVWFSRRCVAAAIFVQGLLVGSFLLQCSQLLLKAPANQSLFRFAVVNASLMLGGMSAAYHLDEFFAKDLQHVMSMRMSAAIPCAIVGLLFGMNFAHFLSNYQVKLKVD